MNDDFPVASQIAIMKPFFSFSPRSAALLALALFDAAASRVLAAPTTPQQLLMQARDAAQSVSFRATQTVQRPHRATETVKVWNGGGKRRYEFQAPAVRRGDVILDNGHDLWIYHRSDNGAVQTRSAKNKISEKTLQNLNVKRAGSATISGRPTIILDVAGRTHRKLWLDAKTRLPLRIERYNGKTRVETTTLNNVRFGAVPSSIFSWKPPADAKITRTDGAYFSNLDAARRTASWLQFPRGAANGFAFESAIVDGARGEAWLRYTDGRQRFSMFQQRAPGADKARRKVGDVWFWQRGGSRFTIVGLSDAQAAAVIDGVK